MQVFGEFEHGFVFAEQGQMYLNTEQQLKEVPDSHGLYIIMLTAPGDKEQHSLPAAVYLGRAGVSCFSCFAKPDLARLLHLNQSFFSQHPFLCLDHHVVTAATSPIL